MQFKSANRTDFKKCAFQRCTLFSWWCTERTVQVFLKMTLGALFEALKCCLLRSAIDEEGNCLVTLASSVIVGFLDFQ